MSVQFPRPGPVLKAVLIALAAFGLGGALLHWLPGEPSLIRLLAFVPD